MEYDRKNEVSYVILYIIDTIYISLRPVRILVTHEEISYTMFE